MLKWGGHFPPPGSPTPLDPASRAFLVGGQALLGLQDGPGTSDLDGSCSTVLAMVRGTRMHAQMGGHFSPPGSPTPLDPASEAFSVGGQASPRAAGWPRDLCFGWEWQHYACNGHGHHNACSNGGVISHPQGPLPPWTLPRGPFWWVVRPS